MIEKPQSDILTHTHQPEKVRAEGKGKELLIDSKPDRSAVDMGFQLSGDGILEGFCFLGRDMTRSTPCKLYLQLL
jgi:hypothetical protein